MPLISVNTKYAEIKPVFVFKHQHAGVNVDYNDQILLEIFQSIQMHSSSSLPSGQEVPWKVVSWL